MKLLFSITFLVLALAWPHAAIAQGTRPSDTYKQFLARCYWAKALTEITPYLSGHWKAHSESLTGVERLNEFKRLKHTYVAKFRLLKEEVIDDRAFVEGEGIAASCGKRCKAHVRAQMIRENGAWKVLYTNWTSTIKGR